eukprot:GHVU01142764.1.p2 GENE.GHVU01142764.1~~GHVU01142764.1.p2  ORF type:complete len:111 (-),score=0.31 GHVU01142764.1:2447-2779(-)
MGDPVPVPSTPPSHRLLPGPPSPCCTDDCRVEAWVRLVTVTCLDGGVPDRLGRRTYPPPDSEVSGVVIPPSSPVPRRPSHPDPPPIGGVSRVGCREAKKSRVPPGVERRY